MHMYINIYHKVWKKYEQTIVHPSWFHIKGSLSRKVGDELESNVELYWLKSMFHILRFVFVAAFSRVP